MILEGDDVAREVDSEAVVYLPAPGSRAMAGIARGSAIVGRSEGPDDVLIYYEDNPGNAVNLVTFAQRALVAFERLADRAPTHRMRVVPRESLTVIGTYSRSQRRVTLAGRKSRAELTAWLGSKRFSPRQLQA